MGKRTKFLFLLAKLYSFCEEKQIEIIIFTFYRDPAQQEQEFMKGKSKIKAGGPHQKWLAQDIAIIEDNKALFDNNAITYAKYQVLGDFWKTLDPNCIWGGDFNFAKDVYHFELSVKK